jgi:AcrR family transcriptional regulator
MSAPAAPTPVLRRDAARNRVKILSAARAVFAEQGTDVCVEVVAHRAQVGVGTLYRRFPTKEVLIEAVVDEVLQDVLAAAEAALENESAADGFAEYLRAVGQLQFEHVGCLTRLWNHPGEEQRIRIESASRALLARAQSAGAVRADLVYEDVIVLFWSLRGVIEATASVSTEVWQRHLEMLWCSLTPGGQPLSHPPLTPGQARRAKDAAAMKESLAVQNVSAG